MIDLRSDEDRVKEKLLPLHRRGGAKYARGRNILTRIGENHHWCCSALSRGTQCSKGG